MNQHTCIYVPHPEISFMSYCHICGRREDQAQDYILKLENLLEVNLNALYEDTWYNPEIHNGPMMMAVTDDGILHIACEGGDKCLIFLRDGQDEKDLQNPHDAWFKIPGTDYWLHFCAI